MPPTPPVPAVTITTDPATPIDMSLATGQEQQVALHFSRSLIWSDFIEKTRFTFMYDGQIHSDVAPVNGGSGVRIDGDDGEILIDIPEWAVPSSDVNINLLIGHKDWVLLGITYDDRYQLKLQDLNGLHLPLLTAQAAVNMVQNHVPLIAVLGSYFLRLTASNGTITYDVIQCSTPEIDSGATFRTRYIDDQHHNLGYVIDNYSCGSTDNLENPSYVTDQFTNLDFDVFDPGDYVWEMGQSIPFTNYLVPTFANDV